MERDSQEVVMGNDMYYEILREDTTTNEFATF